MATSGIFLYDAASGRYRLPQEHAASLTGAAARDVSPMSGIIDHFGKHLPRLVKCFREGGGIPYSEYRPEFTCHMDATWRRIYDELLISGFLGRISGLTERLAAGIGVLDVGCGSGHAVNFMGREFPRSRFVSLKPGRLVHDIAQCTSARESSAIVHYDLEPPVVEVGPCPAICGVSKTFGASTIDGHSAAAPVHRHPAPHPRSRPARNEGKLDGRLPASMLF